MNQNQELKEKRKAAGLTQAQIAKFAGVSERNYRRYESSIVCEPAISTAIRIADALGVRDLRELWGQKVSAQAL